MALRWRYKREKGGWNMYSWNKHNISELNDIKKIQFGISHGWRMLRRKTTLHATCDVLLWEHF